MLPSLKRMLVPIDFSGPSDRALTYATLLASTFGASVHLLHVLDAAMLDKTWAAEANLLEVEAVRSSIITEFEHKLARLLAPALREQLHAHTDVTTGHPANAIVEFARNGHIDLIVMGTHGRSGVAHLLMGSVAEQVVRTAPCPVLTVREAVVPVEDFATIAAIALASGGQI
jgi:universal stress protein A